MTLNCSWTASFHLFKLLHRANLLKEHLLGQWEQAVNLRCHFNAIVQCLQLLNLLQLRSRDTLINRRTRRSTCRVSVTLAPLVDLTRSPCFLLLLNLCKIHWQALLFSICGQFFPAFSQWMGDTSVKVTALEGGRARGEYQGAKLQLGWLQKVAASSTEKALKDNESIH